MAWLPSHQELRDHPKVRRAAAMLGISRVSMIGHLHCLWWWALSYAPDGDVSQYDDDDLALAAEWHGDSDRFVKAIVECGGKRSGFLDAERRLHDWDEYAGKYDAQKRAADGLLGNHVRWHEKRGVTDPDCSLCIGGESGRCRGDVGAMSGDESEGKSPRTGEKSVEEASEPNPQVSGHASGDDIGGDREANRREEKRREEEKVVAPVAKPKRKHSQPDGWAPNDTHKRIAAEAGVDLDREALQFSDFHAAKGSTFTDWDRAFCTWLRNAGEWRGKRHLQPVEDGKPKVIYT